MPAFTLIVPYYRNGAMLARQLREWEKYPDKGISIDVIDDGSPEPAMPILSDASPSLRSRLRLFRITIDLPWNREGARNLGATEAKTDWILNVDIDHVLPAKAAAALLTFHASPSSWYRFPRWRVGRADETRRKDEIPDDCAFGRVKPHVDSHLMTKELYWKAGGYDEDFVGCLGGGSNFQRRVAAISEPKMLPDEICLHVHTRDVVPDASDWSLSRDTTRGKEIEREKVKRGELVPRNPLRFPWVRQL